MFNPNRSQVGAAAAAIILLTASMCCAEAGRMFMFQDRFVLVPGDTMTGTLVLDMDGVNGLEVDDDGVTSLRIDEDGNVSLGKPGGSDLTLRVGLDADFRFTISEGYALSELNWDGGDYVAYGVETSSGTPDENDWAFHLEGADSKDYGLRADGTVHFSSTLKTTVDCSSKSCILLDFMGATGGNVDDFVYKGPESGGRSVHLDALGQMMTTDILPAIPNYGGFGSDTDHFASIDTNDAQFYDAMMLPDDITTYNTASGVPSDETWLELDYVESPSIQYEKFIIGHPDRASVQFDPYGTLVFLSYVGRNSDYMQWPDGSFISKDFHLDTLNAGANRFSILEHANYYGCAMAEGHEVTILGDALVTTQKNTVYSQIDGSQVVIYRLYLEAYTQRDVDEIISFTLKERSTDAIGATTLTSQTINLGQGSTGYHKANYDLSTPQAVSQNWWWEFQCECNAPEAQSVYFCRVASAYLLKD